MSICNSKLVKLVLLSALLACSTSCMKKSANSGAAGTSSSDPTVDETSGKKIFKMDPAKGGTLSASGINSKDPNFSKSTVAIPPGALSIPVDVALFESTPIVNTTTQASLGVSGAAPAGPAVAIIPSASVAITGSLVISLPYTQSMSLTGDSQFVVFGMYQNGSKFDVETFVGDELTFDASGIIKINIKRFGAFQVARVAAAIPKKTAESTTGFTSQKEAESSGAANYMAFYVANASEMPACDATRVSHLYYVLATKQFQACNGSSWSVLDMSPPKVVLVSDLFANPSESSEETVNNQRRMRTTTTYSAVRGGPIVRSCFTEFWTTPAPGGNGSIIETQNGGDAQCSVGGSKYIACDEGFKPTATGCVGSKPAPSNHNLIKHDMGSSLIMVDDKPRYRFTFKYYETLEATGDPVRTCHTDTWTSQIENGSISFSQSGGDDGCDKGGSRSVGCNPYFGLQNGACVPICSTANLNLCTTLDQCQGQSITGQTASNSGSDTNYYYFFPGKWENGSCQAACSNGKIATVRGCEQPVTCGTDQKVVANQCVNIVWQEVSGDLLGNYSNPVKITAGTHKVLDNVQFNNVVKFEADAILEFTGNFGISANSLVYALGTESQPVIFRGEKNSAEQSVTWKGFRLGTEYDSSRPVFSVKGNYISGSKFSYFEVQDSACGSALTNQGSGSQLSAFSENIKITCANPDQWLALSGYFHSSEINQRYVEFRSDYSGSTNVVNNTSIGIDQNSSAHMRNVFMLASTIKGYLNVSEGSYVAFSDVNRADSISPSTIFIGNKISGQYEWIKVPDPRGLEVTENSKDDISNATAVIAMTRNPDAAPSAGVPNGKVNSPFEVYALVFNKDGIINDASVTWQTSAIGSTGSGSSSDGSGNPLTWTPASEGLYEITATSVTPNLEPRLPITSLIGSPSIRTQIMPNSSAGAN